MVAAVVMEEERRAVIDEVDLAMPEKQVRISRGAVDVLGKSVEPDGERSLCGRGFVTRRRIEHGGAGKVIQREVESERWI